MAYGNNENEYEAGAPKKADVLIRSTQHIALKQDELSEQTKKVAARIDEAIELFVKSSQDPSYLQQSTEIFNRLQGENSALKQELLYLAKQSENIYAGLAEKINELSEQARSRDESLNGLAEKIDAVVGQSKKSEEVCAAISDRLAEFAEQNKRNEQLLISIGEKLDAVNARSLAAEPVGDREPVAVDNSAVLEKLNYVSEQLRRNEGAHSMLADKFEILSMRVEQFGFESAKGQSAGYRQNSMSYAVPAQTADIDYDALAEKVASLISARDVISPDYIASKVAEQIVVPEVDAKNVHVSVDTHEMAKEVAELVNGSVRTEAVAAPVTTNVNIDEEGLADAIAHRLADMRNGELAPASAAPDFDEEALAERIASKIGTVKAEIAAPADAVINIDKDELADAIALKVGSLKAEDFEILVDDDGCNSISKNIADSLNYEVISNIIADKLQEALDLASVNAPDYEEMAERISEKITVAGINEDAIADKAAAALSNYLPEFDTDEITDKITGAVIDVVSAMPQPSVDNELICNNISQRLIESQEDHDYDIVLDDDGISKITGLVSEEIEEKTGARFDKVEGDIAKLCELLESKESAVQTVAEPVAVTETVEEVAEPAAEKTVAEINEEDYGRLSGLMAAEIEKGTSARFDKVEDDIAKLTELLSSVTAYDEESEEEEYDVQEEQEEQEAEDDYSLLSEVVAEQIQKNVASRLDGVEESLAKLNGYFAEEEAQPDDAEGEDEYGETEEVEEDYSALSEVIAAELDKGLSARFVGLEENIARIAEYVTAEEAQPVEAEEAVEEERDYTALSEAVVAEFEKQFSSRLDSVQEDIAKISEYITAEAALPEEQYIEGAEGGFEEVNDYSALSEVVAAEIERGIAYRLDSMDENIAKLTEALSGGSDGEASAEEEVEEIELDYTALSEAVAAELEKGLSPRFDGVDENIAKLVDMVAGNADGKVVAEAAGEDYSRLSEVVAAEIERGMRERFDKVEDDIAKLSERVTDTTETNARFDKIEENIAKISDLVEGGAESKDDSRLERLEEKVAKISEIVEADNGKDDNRDNHDARFDKLEEGIAKISELVESNGADGKDDERLDKIQEDIAKISDYVEDSDNKDDDRFDKVQDDVAQIKQMISEGVIVAGVAAAESASADAAKQSFEEFEEDEEEEDDDDDKGDDFMLDVFDMDEFSDNELMPGELSDFGGVDFANMMKFKRSFIARIIMSNDEYKQYYGEVKHALISYKKVNSNVAWGAERFNKGRETIARLKIRGKTLCLYLALDPNNYKTSVYHHLDVSDNKSVEGTPMMVKVKSALGVRKAIRLIDEMLAMRGGEKKDIPERDYAAMYPYETIEELIEDGLVKDVRKK